MRTNDLCSYWEHRFGYSSNYTKFGIMVYHNNIPIAELATESELHEFIFRELTMDERDTYGSWD
jgi:hypothetical protein